MMWRLKHRLFGWHYVHMSNTATDIIRRVRHTKSGRAYVVYFSDHLVFLDEPRGWWVTELTTQEAKA